MGKNYSTDGIDDITLRDLLHRNKKGERNCSPFFIRSHQVILPFRVSRISNRYGQYTQNDL
jgi:hypothetical protein